MDNEVNIRVVIYLTKNHGERITFEQETDIESGSFLEVVSKVGKVMDLLKKEGF